MRKNLPKIITLFFLLVFVLQIAGLIFLFLLPSSGQAIDFTPQVDIGANVQVIDNNSIGEYIRAIYNYAIGIVGILATVVMMIGGIVWITAGGNQTRVGEAKAWIGASLSGLVLALASYTILAAVNPALVNFQPLKIGSPTKPIVPKMLNDRYKDCSWDVIPGVNCGKNRSKSDGQCAGDPPEGRAFYTCCCTIVPLAGCSWKKYCSNTGTISANNELDCGSNPNPVEYNYCCCPKLGGDWVFDSKIEAQLPDVSLELSELMYCLRNNLPENVGRISSISDSAGIDTCRDTYNSSICAHSQNSCHYGGGGSVNKSYAIDIGDEENLVAIQRAAKACEAYVGKYINEGNHIHMSAVGCVKD